MKQVIKEFKEFINKGNVVDLAVGVIIGTAFSKIVTSLVNDMLMPLIGVIIGGLDFSTLSIKIKDATIMYGSFIQNIIDFLIIAFCVFMFVKIINRFSKKTEKKKDELPKKDPQLEILEEIRDLLKEEKKKTKKNSK